MFVLFAVSGFVGILAERVFEKMLSGVAGGTTLALATYFIGLNVRGWRALSPLERSCSTPRYNFTDVDWMAVNTANLRSFASSR